mgnify:CR=1 FL=1
MNMKKYLLLFGLFFAVWAMSAQTVNVINEFFLQEISAGMNLPAGHLLFAQQFGSDLLVLVHNQNIGGALYISRSGKPFVRLLADIEGKTIGKLVLTDTSLIQGQEYTFYDWRSPTMDGDTLWFSTIGPLPGTFRDSTSAVYYMDIVGTQMRPTKIMAMGGMFTQGIVAEIGPIFGREKRGYFTILIRTPFLKALMKYEGGEVREVFQYNQITGVNPQAMPPFFDGNVFWFQGYSNLPEVLFRLTPTGKMTTAIDTSSFMGEVIDRSWTPLYNQETNTMYAYVQSPTVDQDKKLVKFLPDGKPVLMKKGRLAQVITNGRIGVVSDSSNQYATKAGLEPKLILSTRQLANGEKLVFPTTTVSAVRGCAATLLPISYPSWTIAEMWRVSIPCITSSPTEVISGQRVTLTGENFELGNSLVDILVGNSAPLSADKVEGDKITFTVPVTLSGDMKFSVRLTHTMGVMISDPVIIKVKPGIELPEVSARFMPEAVDAGQETELVWQANLLAHAEMLTCVPPLGSVVILTNFNATNGRIIFSPEQSMTCSLTVRFQNGSITAIEGLNVSVNPPLITAVTNAVDVNAGLSSGGFGTIWGSSFSSRSCAIEVNPSETLCGVSVVLPDGKTLPLFFVSPGQINFRVPDDLAPGDVWFKVRGKKESDWFKVAII